MGGSCAVANIILRILFDLAIDQPNRAHVQDQIKNQIHTLHKSNDGLVSIEDRVPLLKAAMHETIRLTCSPIVPHQATQDSEIGGELKIKLMEYLLFSPPAFFLTSFFPLLFSPSANFPSHY